MVRDMRLLLIRHGQTPNNILGALDTGRPGAGLTELGREQARAIPAALAAREHRRPLRVPARAHPRDGRPAGRGARSRSAASPRGSRRSLPATSRCTGMPSPSRPTSRPRRSGAVATSTMPWPAARTGTPSGPAIQGRCARSPRAIRRRRRSRWSATARRSGCSRRSLRTSSRPPATDAPCTTRAWSRSRAIRIRGGGWIDWIDGPLGGAHLLGNIRHDVTADENADAAV